MKWKDKLNKLFNKNQKYNVNPTSITIDISNRCNAACPFCSRQISSLRRNEIMPKDMFYCIMEQVSQIKSIKSVVLAAWGEPMLHPDFDEFVDFLTSKGYKVGFPSNMSLAHNHFDSILKVSHIMLSIEGHDKETYSNSRKNLNFDVVYNNVKELDTLIKEKRSKGEKTPTREINFLINKESDIDEYMNTWSEFVDIVRIGPVLPVALWDKTLNCSKLITNEELRGKMLPCDSMVKNMYCAQPFKSIFVRANGKLALCCSDYDFDLDLGDYSNIKTSYFNNIQFKKIRKEFRKNQLEICKNCFQNFEIKKEDLFRFLPSLSKYSDKPKIVIYSNR